MEEADSDEALMAAYAGGDRRSFERLFARYGPKIHGFFMRTFGDRAMADELFQATFLRVHKARHSYRPGLPLRPWLFAIAANVRVDELRRRQRRPETLDHEQFDRADEARAIDAAREADTDRTEIAVRVRAALQALPESQRVVVVLHRYEGMTFGEIARIVGSSEGAVRVRAFRAYEALRKSLRELLSDEEGQTDEHA